MVDIASLGIKIDSQGMVEATQGLDKLEKSSASAGKAADDVGKAWGDAGKNVSSSARAIGESAEEASSRLRSMVQQSIEVSRANGVASESQRSLAERARETAQGMRAQTSAATDWAAEQARISANGARILATERNLAEQSKKSAAAAAEQRGEMQKLLGQIDPTIAKLEKLAEMEEKLAEYGGNGFLKPQVVQQYQEKIDGLRQKVLDSGKALKNGGEAAGEMGKKLGDLNLNAVTTQRSIASLARALMTGDWAQARESVTALTARTGAMRVAFSGTGVAIAGAAAAAALFAVQVWKGYEESRKLEGVMLATGSAAGVTAGQVANLTREIGSQSGKYDEAAAAANDLLLSGKATGDTFESIMRSAANLSSLTGQTMQQAADDISSLSTGGADALQRLNQKYGFLTREVYEHITSLREQGRETEAVKVELKALEDVSADRAAKMRDQAGWVESAWEKVKNAVSGTKRAIQDVGRTDAQYQLEVAERQLADAKMGRPVAIGGGSLGGVNAAQLTASPSMISGYEDRVAAAKKRVDEESAKAARDNATKDAFSGLEGLNAEVRRYESREAQRVRAIAEIHSNANKAAAAAIEAGDHATGADIRAAEKKALAGIEERYKDKGGAGGGRSAGVEKSGMQERLQAFRDSLAVEQGAIANSTTLLEAQYSARLITAGEYYARMREYTTAGADAEEKALVGQIEVLKARDTAGKDSIDTQRQIGQLEAQLTKLRADSATKLAVLDIQEKVRAEQKAQSIAVYAGALERSNEALRKQMDTAVLRVGMGEREFEIQSKINDAYAEQADRLRELAQQLSNGQIGKDVHDAQAAIAVEKTDERVRAIQDGYKRMGEAEADWRNGAIKSMRDYVQESSNVAGQMGGMFTSAFSGAEDAFVKFAMTGKASFSSLANSIIADLVRIAAKQAIVGVIGNIASSFFGGVSAANTASATAGSVNINNQLTNNLLYGGGRASGGSVSGGKFYEVGENGKPELFQQHGKTYLIPGSGGSVIPAASSAGESSSGGVNIGITVNVANDGSSSTSAQGDDRTQAKQLGQLLTAKVKEVIASEMRPGGQIWKMSHG